MPTYNHEPFIGQAIEGVMRQKTTFPIRLFIADDCSTDNTREICISYKEKYPDQIDLILRERNLGAVNNAPGLYEKCFSYSRYTAMCEGDDYWTDPLKLQKQIDLLEADANYAICFHAVKVIYDGVDKDPYVSNPAQAEVTDFEDLALGNYIHTPSCVFRNHLFDSFPSWFRECSAGDYPLHLLNAQFGKIRFLPDVMAVYRIHAGGVWSWQDREKPTVRFIQVMELCRQHFAPRAAAQFSRGIDDLNKDLCILTFENGKYADCRSYYSKSPHKLRRYGLKTSAGLAMRYFLSGFPGLAFTYKRIRLLFDPK